MSQRVLRGLAASSGIAAGTVLVVRDVDPDATNGTGGGAADRERARAALVQVAEELGRLSEAAQAGGRGEEAEILAANRLMAEDPALLAEVEQLAETNPASVAVAQATERHANLLAALDDPYLAARAADIRQLGKRAVRILVGAPTIPQPEQPSIVLARDLGPADVAELELAEGRILGIALAEGAATSHVAIMARALGLPLVVALGHELLQADDAETVVLDGDNGVAVLSPTVLVRERAERAVESLRRERQELAATRGLPSVTTDGHPVRLLCNAVTAAEIAAGLEAGADGVGLLRTELAFLEAHEWPSVPDHLRVLEPALAVLEGRTATVRTLDFGADKTPPFLEGIVERGLALALARPSAFLAQLCAILRAGSETQLRILLPLVESASQFETARSLLEEALFEVDWSGPPPQLGAMIETPAAAEQAGEIAAVADFLSIGTNDLVQYTLRLDRELPLATAQAAADPKVLDLIVRIAEAAHAHGRTVEVCGEAAGELPVAVLLVGAGIDELSASPARIDALRGVVRSISAREAAGAVQSALAARSAAAAVDVARELLRSHGAPEHPGNLAAGQEQRGSVV
jgi:phosphoenolpyruvate-protein kinase (PTS system EI component)